MRAQQEPVIKANKRGRLGCGNKNAYSKVFANLRKRMVTSDASNLIATALRTALLEVRAPGSAPFPSRVTSMAAQSDAHHSHMEVPLPQNSRQQFKSTSTWEIQKGPWAKTLEDKTWSKLHKWQVDLEQANGILWTSLNVKWNCGMELETRKSPTCWTRYETLLCDSLGV